MKEIASDIFFVALLTMCFFVWSDIARGQYKPSRPVANAMLFVTFAAALKIIVDIAQVFS